MSNEYKDYTKDRYDELVDKLNEIEDLAKRLMDITFVDIAVFELCVDILKIIEK